MLADKDRIFTNVYGFQPWTLDAAIMRGDWDDTKGLMARGQRTFTVAANISAKPKFCLRRSPRLMPRG